MKSMGARTMAGHERDSKRERFWRKVLARRSRSGLPAELLPMRPSVIEPAA